METMIIEHIPRSTDVSECRVITTALPDGRTATQQECQRASYYSPPSTLFTATTTICVVAALILLYREVRRHV